MTDKLTIFQCSHIGVSGTTDVHIKKGEDGLYEARLGIALLGMTNMSEEDFERCDGNPFHAQFRDNYASGKGKTKQEAIEALKKDKQDISDSLWAI